MTPDVGEDLSLEAELADGLAIYALSLVVNTPPPHLTSEMHQRTLS